MRFLQLSKFLMTPMLIALAFANISVRGQSTENAVSVKWQPVIGQEKQFVVFMPGGYKVIVDRDPGVIFSRKGKRIAPKRTVKTARFINGTLLLLTYHMGDGEELFNTVVNSIPPTAKLSAPSHSGVFSVSEFRTKIRNRYVRTQYFRAADQFYELAAFSPSQEDPIAKAFFDSVRVFDGKTYLSPNASSEDEETVVPKLLERPRVMTREIEYKENEVDRALIMLSFPRFSVSNDARTPLTGIGANTGRVVVKALFSHDGSVKILSFGGSLPSEVMRGYADTIENIQFVPAEKGGELVSVVREFKYERTTEIRAVRSVLFSNDISINP